MRGTTEAINLVAQSVWPRRASGPGDEILISWLEHHANIVPWQMLCEQTGATLRVAPITQSGEVDFDAFAALLSPRARSWSRWRTSRTRSAPSSRCSDSSRRPSARGVPVLLDGAQAVPHMRVDVQALDCDFYAFSGHKMCGPTGIGVLYGREALLSAMPPWQGGGDMILRRHRSRRPSTTACRTSSRPARRDIAGAIGLGAAIDYLEALGMDRIAAARAATCSATRTSGSPAIPGLRFVGTAPEKAAVVSFTHRQGASARPRHDPRPRGRRDPHRPPLRDAGHGVLRRCRRRRAPRSPSTTRVPRSTGWSRALHTAREMLG